MAVPSGTTVFMIYGTHQCDYYLQETDNYNEILRLHNHNYSQSEIAASIHSFHSTIQEVLSLSAVLKIS